MAVAAAEMPGSLKPKNRILEPKKGAWRSKKSAGDFGRIFFVKICSLKGFALGSGLARVPTVRSKANDRTFL